MAMMLSPECKTRRAEDTLENSALIFADGPAGFNTGLHGSDRTDPMGMGNDAADLARSCRLMALGRRSLGPRKTSGLKGKAVVRLDWSAGLSLTQSGHGRPAHSITSSARASNVGERVRPSAIAVFTHQFELGRPLDRQLGDALAAQHLLSAMRGPSLTPPISKGDLADGTTGNWPICAQRIANGHQRERKHGMRQTQDLPYIILIQNMVGGNEGTEAKGPTRENDVLDCWVDAGASNSLLMYQVGIVPFRHGLRQRLASRHVAFPQTRYQEDGRVAHVLPKMASASH